MSTLTAQELIRWMLRLLPSSGLFLGLAPLAAAQADPLAAFRLPPDFASRVVLTLAVDKVTYLRGEPIRAELSLENVSASSFIGPLTLSPHLPRTRVHYAPAGGVWRAMTSGLEGDGIEPLRQLEAGQAIREAAWLSIDRDLDRPPLDRDGPYELYATFTVALSEDNLCEVRSKTVRIEVRSPQGEELLAYAAYTPALAALPIGPHIPGRHFPDALAFVRQFPRSVYSRAIGHMVLAGVRSRLKDRSLEDAERRRLERALAELAREFPPTAAER